MVVAALVPNSVD